MALPFITGVNKLLTQVARGYSNPLFVGDELFPIVEVDDITGNYVKFGKEAFDQYDFERALRADPAITPGLSPTSGTYHLKEHVAMFKLDYLEADMGSPKELDMFKANQDLKLQQLNLEREIAQATEATTAGNYASTNKVALSDDYLDEAAIDPIDYIASTACSPIQTQVGHYPNKLVMSGLVWDKLRRHPKVTAYLGTSANRIMTSDLFGEILGIEKVIIAYSVVNNKGKAAPLHVWGNNIVLAYVKPPSALGYTPYEPCFGFTFRGKGRPYVKTSESEGGFTRSGYVADLYDVHIAGADSGFLISTPITPPAVQ